MCQQGYEKFASIMSALYAEQDFQNPESRYAKKLNYAFELILKAEWTYQELEETMTEFAKRQKSSRYWMPAEIFEIHEELFPNYKEIC